MLKRTMLGVMVAMLSAAQAQAATNLLVNPGFEDTDAVPDGIYGDGWGAYGAAGFHTFFGPNAHASLFPDFADNLGGVFQLGIPGTAGTTYQLDLLDTRIESSFDASLRFGLEYYLADDATKIGETIVTIDAAARLANAQTDGNVFSMQGTAVPGTQIVRPIVLFDDVNPAYIGQSQANVFVFNSYLSEAPAPGQEMLKNPGFGDETGDTNLGDYWGSYGATGFNDFFGGNTHASLFADFAGNNGGLYQQAVLGTPGTEYRFGLEDVRIEDNWDAELVFGLEFFGDDDFTKIGEALTIADTSVTGDGLSFEITGTAVPGTKYVRPIIMFDNVNPAYIGQAQANLFIFETSLAEVVAMLVGDLNGDGFVGIGDLNIVLGNWNQSVAAGDKLQGDPSGDGFVGIEDLNTVLGNWNAGTPPTSAVPEPGSLALLGLMGVSLLRRKG